MKKTFLLSISLFLLLTSTLSCSNRELRKELHILDEVIDNRDVYLNRFYAKVGQTRDSLAVAASDSLAWKYSYDLFNDFVRFSTDSALVYLEKMERYAAACSSPRMKYSSALSRLQLDIARDYLAEAGQTFVSLDTTGLNLSAEEQFDYYNRIGAYWVMVRDANTGALYDSAKRFVNESRKKAVQIDSLSFTGRKLHAILYNQKGMFDKSLETLLPCWSWDTLTDLDRSITAYNIASIYRWMGDEVQEMVWLARSAQYDYMVPVNNYLSVYHLAKLLYDHKMYERSQRYINFNLTDIIEANYQQRMRRSGEMHVLISSANHKIQMRRIRLISVIGIIFLAMSLVLVRLLRKNNSLLRLTEDKNEQILKVNRKLKEANTIKEEYLFRYMVLSTQYMIQVEDTRHELRQIAKKEGVDAMIQKLRSHGNTDEELAKFYRVFDETFLSIFPDFVEKVNAMLREDCHIRMKPDNVMPTELRILASIRLGMKESGKIAEFLNCAPATVYTYRTKILNMASCPREEFERKLMDITSY